MAGADSRDCSTVREQLEPTDQLTRRSRRGGTMKCAVVLAVCLIQIWSSVAGASASSTGGSGGLPAIGPLKPPTGPPTQCVAPGGFPDKAMDAFNFDDPNNRVLENRGATFVTSMAGHGDAVQTTLTADLKAKAVLNRYPANSCLLRPERCVDGWSIAFWVNVTYDSSTSGIGLIGTQTNFMKYTEGAWIRYSAAGNRFGFGVLGIETQTEKVISIEPAAAPKGWIHVAFTYYQENLTGYINGELQKPTFEDDYGKPIEEECDNTLMVGVDGLSEEFAYGSNAQFDDVYIYQRVLNEDEIKQLMGPKPN